MSLIILAILIIVLLAIGVPIAFGVATSCFFYMVIEDINFFIIPQRLYNGVDSFPLLALPLFILTGQIMNFTGITERLINFCSALVGHIRGGLAIVNVVASMFFAGVSGSAVADTASIGSVMIPSMIKRKYPPAFSAAVTSSSATIGIIIPPSNAMIIHGMVAGVSVGKLFMAGLIPGIIVGLFMILICYIVSRIRKYPTETNFSIKNIIKTFWKASSVLILPVIIIGGISFGIFTPTEAAGIAAVYSITISIIFFKTLNLKTIYRLLVNASIVTASIMIIISTSMLLGWVLAHERVPQMIVNYATSLPLDSTSMLIIITLLLIIAGTFLHGAPLQLIIVPILLPLIRQIGIDPLLFGIVVVFCVGIGQQTPPVGSALYVTSSLSGSDILEITKENIPFIFSIIVTMYLIIFFPKIALFLPKLLFD